MRKASLEGMSEAFGSSTEADDHQRAAKGEEGGRELFGALMRPGSESDKRELGRPPMRNCMAGQSCNR